MSFLQRIALYSFIATVLICLVGVSQSCAQMPETTSASIIGLTMEQYMEAPMPKESCTTWVRWKTGNEKIPEVLIVHVVRNHSENPYLLVVSEIKDHLAFRNILEEINHFWDGSDIREIYDRGDDITSIIRFWDTYAAKDDWRRSIQYYGGNWAGTDMDELFYAQFELVIPKQYQSSEFEQHCTGIPKWMVEKYPFQNNIEKSKYATK